MKIKNIQKTVIVAVLGVLLSVVHVPSRASAANDPFVCSSNFYQVISGQLKLLDPVNGTYTNVGSAQVDEYNAIGYNVVDNYIYGIKTTATSGVGAVGNLVRIGSDGTMTDLGAVSGLPVTGHVNASIDLNGNMYIVTGVHTVYKISLSGMTATPLTLTGDNIGFAIENVYLNNKLYVLSGSTLSIVDLAANNVSNVTVTGPSGWVGFGFYGAGWTAQTGELFFSNNNSGSIYKITNLDAASPTATLAVTGTITNNNDGASCPLSPQSPFDPPAASNDSFTAASNNANNGQITGSLLGNDNGVDLTVTGNTSPSHGTVTVSPNGTFVYMPANGFSGTDSFTYTVTDAFGRSTTATVSLTVPASTLAAAAATLKAPATGLAATVKTHTWLPLTLPAALIVGFLSWRRLKTYFVR